jgi:hypothetical protein
VAETITLVSKRSHRDPGIRHDLAVIFWKTPEGGI